MPDLILLQKIARILKDLDKISDFELKHVVIHDTFNEYEEVRQELKERGLFV